MNEFEKNLIKYKLQDYKDQIKLYQLEGIVVLANGRTKGKGSFISPDDAADLKYVGCIPCTGSGYEIRALRKAIVHKKKETILEVLNKIDVVTYNGDGEEISRTKIKTEKEVAAEQDAKKSERKRIAEEKIAKLSLKQKEDEELANLEKKVAEAEEKAKTVERSKKTKKNKKDKKDKKDKKQDGDVVAAEAEEKEKKVESSKKTKKNKNAKKQDGDVVVIDAELKKEVVSETKDIFEV